MKLVLPFGSPESLKNLVFSILTKEYPLKIITLNNLVKKRYGRSVTYQAVRKALLELAEEGVLVEEKGKYQINKDWVTSTKKTVDELHAQLNKKKTTPDSLDSIKGEVSVFEFDSLNKLMQFWEQIIDDWYKNFKQGDPNYNYYQGAHTWEGLLHPDTEQQIMSQLKDKGIISYALTTSNTPLDKYLIKFYTDVGLIIGSNPSTKHFDKKFYVATYGETIVQTIYPDDLVHAMEEFFHKNTSIENMNLRELSDVANKKTKMTLTVIKNLQMAEHINQGIIKEIEGT